MERNNELATVKVLHAGVITGKPDQLQSEKKANLKDAKQGASKKSR